MIVGATPRTGSSPLSRWRLVSFGRVKKMPEQHSHGKEGPSFRKAPRQAVSGCSQSPTKFAGIS